MKRFTIGLILFLISLVGLWASGCSDGFAENITIDEFDFSRIKELRVDGKLFTVHVEGVTGNSVKGVVKAPNKNEYFVKIKQEGDVLILLCEKYPAFAFASPQIILTVPQNLDITITNSSGSIGLENLRGTSLNLESTSGSISVSDCSNDITCSSTSGDIKIRNVEGNKVLNASSGSISIEDSTGDVTVETTSGSISCTAISGDIKAEASSGSINFRSIEGTFQVETTSGTIQGSKIFVSNHSEFKSSSGTIEIDFENPHSDLSFDLSSSSGSLIAGDKSGIGSLIVGNGEIKIKGSSQSGSQNYQ